MKKIEIQKHYKENKQLYQRLAENTKQALLSFLQEDGISYHSISSRIKEFDSYYEKIERKGYDKPLEQIEDFCGIRIICFYPADLERIKKIIQKEFDVLESIDKTANLEPDRFGYRSNHFIVKIKKEWLKAPNYRGLEDLKSEIQVRTILMHSWADIEHKLAYKKNEDVPLEFRRKLYQLSALLEIADTQFQDLKNQKENLKQSLIITKKGKSHFDISQNTNLDSLQSYLDFTFPNRMKGNNETSQLLEELNELELTLTDIESFRKDLEEILPKIEKDMVKGKWAQVGIVRAILDLKSDKYWNNRSKDWQEGKWGKNIVKWRKELK